MGMKISYLYGHFKIGSVKNLLLFRARQRHRQKVCVTDVKVHNSLTATANYIYSADFFS